MNAHKDMDTLMGRARLFTVTGDGVGYSRQEICALLAVLRAVCVNLDWASLEDWPNRVCVYGGGTVGNSRVGMVVTDGGGTVGRSVAVGVGVKVTAGVEVAIGDGV